MKTKAETDTQSSGSLFGGILLISGCCIGAGMLGLPVLSAIAGFKPSIAMLLLSWVFMLSTGLLLLEVNLWFTEEVSIISMAGRTLGWIGKAIGWAGFLFLFYAIMVAYISGSGELFSGFVNSIAGYPLAPWIGSLVLTMVFTLFLYLGTRAVDHFNRFMMGGLVISYLLLVGLGLPHIDLTRLNHQEWPSAFLMLPTMIISFGYHNLIPSLKTYYGGNVKKLRLAVIIGSAIPLLIYFLWELLILGLIPLEGSGGLRQALGEGYLPTQLLEGAIGSSWVVTLAHYFSFFAIVTSFLGVGLSFVDFLADGLHVKKTAKGKLLLCALVAIPPFLLAMTYPRIFLTALSYAGAFGAVVLFGILPAAMVWSGRYIKGLKGVPQLPGGKASLLFVILFAISVIVLQITIDAVAN
ncbi:MAG: tyrosine transporter [Parachlamydiaceae bacterium]|nr:tyrosine transporter [Parachlamydiaceae bacterium]